MQARLPKSRRVPDLVAPLALTERSISIIRSLAGYRFLSTSTLVKLAGGNEDVTHRHLQALYHRGIISRLTIPRFGSRGEFIYLLDNCAGLREISSRLGIEIDWECVRTNRERYSPEALAKADGVGRFMFLRHELMISDFRAALEVACRQSSGRHEIVRFDQGPNLWDSVRISPRVTLPFRPDALLTLRSIGAAEGQQRANFFYESDRATTSLPRFKSKLEAYLSYLKQGLQVKAFEIRRVRAVLVETITAERMEQCKAAASEIAAKEPLARLLFWFTNARRSTPESPFHPQWQTAEGGVWRSLLD